MVHKPMCSAYGNANELKDAIDMLEKVENSTMIPMYMAKAKISEEEVKDLIAKESWLSADEMNEYFDVELLKTTNKVAACVDKDIFSKYKNVPENFKELLNNIKTVEINSSENEEKRKKEELVKNKLKLISSSLFVKKNKF